jgi:hypothetical protein
MQARAYAGCAEINLAITIVTSAAPLTLSPAFSQPVIFCRGSEAASEEE